MNPEHVFHGQTPMGAALLPETSEIQRISLIEQLNQARREVEFLESGGYGLAPSWLYLLGWADWKTEWIRIETQLMNLGRS